MRPGELEDARWLAFCASQPARPIYNPAVTGPYLVASGRLIVTGLSVFNTTTGGGALDLIDGQDLTGRFITRLQVGAGVGASWTGPSTGVLCLNGLYAQPHVNVTWATAYVIDVPREHINLKG